MKAARVVLLSMILLFIFSQVGLGQTNGIQFTQEEKDFIRQHPVIKLGVDPNFTPYEFIDSDGQYKGIAADYLTLISRNTGIQFEISKELTWTEAYEKAVEKKVDGLPCVTKTQEREKYFIYSNPYYSFQRVIVVKEENDAVTDLKDLYGRTIAVKRDGSHYSYLKAFPSIKLSLYLTEQAAIEAVATGKESYYVGNLATSSYLIKTNGFTNLKYIEVNSDQVQNLYFAIRNDWPELVTIINKGLASITEEEKISINNKWIGFKNKVDYGPILKWAAVIASVVLGFLLVSLFWILKLKSEIAAKLKAQDALNAAKNEAEIANSIKSLFLARMSHEIRTPLHAIIGMSYLLKKTNLTAVQRNYLEKIILSSKDMLAIINDILDFSKIEAGKTELEYISFNLDKVLQQVVNIVSLKIEEQNIAFSLQKDPDLPLNFYGDPTKLQQILLNIINNALKFTKNGEVSVDIHLRSLENTVCLTEFSVRDNGIGMTTEQVDKMFVPFDQGDSSINRRFGGSGLGLSIAKSFIDLMGGSIQVGSTIGEGTTFTIRLPLEIDREREAQDKRKTASYHLGTLQILVLEDNASNLNLLDNYLRSFNMTADLATSAKKAHTVLRNASLTAKPFDLIIVDNDTPKAGGLDYVQIIRNDPEVEPKPKFILMVSLKHEELLERMDEAGIDFALSKPVIPSVLYNGILEIFRDKVLDGYDQNAEKIAEKEFITDYPYHVLVVEDNKTNQMIAEAILEQAGFKVSLADDGHMGYEFFQKYRQELDLILMDLHMPVLNGYESTSLIRKISPTIPIVAMTADAVTGVEEQCREAGINNYISKPFEPEQFIGTIRNVLEQVRTERKETKKHPLLDEEEGGRRIGNNKDLYLQILKAFYLENQGISSTLTESILRSNYPEAIQIVHKIKSSAGNIGARSLLAVAVELQEAMKGDENALISKLHQEFQEVLLALLKVIAERIKGV